MKQRCVHSPFLAQVQKRCQASSVAHTCEAQVLQGEAILSTILSPPPHSGYDLGIPLVVFSNIHGPMLGASDDIGLRSLPPFSTGVSRGPGWKGPHRVLFSAFGHRAAKVPPKSAF